MNTYHTKLIQKFFVVKEFAIHFLMCIIIYVLILNTFFNILYYYFDANIVKDNYNKIVLILFAFCALVLLILQKLVKKFNKKKFIAAVLVTLGLLLLTLAFLLPDYFEYNKSEIDIYLYKKDLSNFALISIVFLLKIQQVYQHNQSFITITKEKYFKIHKKFQVVSFTIFCLTIFIGYFSLP